jgi:YD repeat-containing protein
VKDANGKSTSFAYTSRGYVYEVKDAQSNITSYTYNKRGDKLTERHYCKLPDGSTETLLTTWTYDGQIDPKLVSHMQQRFETLFRPSNDDGFACCSHKPQNEFVLTTPSRALKSLKPLPGKKHHFPIYLTKETQQLLPSSLPLLQKLPAHPRKRQATSLTVTSKFCSSSI